MISEKVCFKCDTLKPLSGYYKHAEMSDGYLGKCKECTKSDVAAHRAENISKIREYDRDRAKLPHRKAHIKRTVERHNEENPLQYSARNKVNNAVRDGRLLKPASCSKCGDNHHQIEGHHEDYSKPLDVIWVCPPCHWHLDEARRKKEEQLTLVS